MKALYITHNGLADHIGQSQILPYLLGLAKEGFSIAVVSAEKNAKKDNCIKIEAHLAAAGVTWRPVPYHNNPPLVSTLFDLFRMYGVAKALIESTDVGVIHCRSFLPTFLGLFLKRKYGIPVIFDFRDFWADRGLRTKPFKFVYRFIKWREGWMIRNSDHVVTLTEKARTILSGNYLQGQLSSVDDRFTVIPTCADLDLFDTRKVPQAARNACRDELGLSPNDLVFGYLGTFHEDYIPHMMFRAFKVLQSIKPEAKFLFVTPGDHDEIFRFADACGVQRDDLRIISADRENIAKILAVFSLSVVFIRADESTAGVSPTKLAELFACNIPVLANPGVGDMDRIVSPERNDSVLVEDFSEAALQRALLKLLEIMALPRRLGRQASEQFSLDEGIRRYHHVYSKFIKPSKTIC
jgi:glycosyltransferase involved in cell wall biosynthesis